jgi:hypothetical protein
MGSKCTKYKERRLNEPEGKSLLTGNEIEAKELELVHDWEWR